MSEIKLLPCPFCGGQVDLFSWSQTPLNYEYGIECRECQMLFQVNRYGSTKEDVVSLWNTRKPMERIVERLEELEEDNTADWQRFHCDDDFGRACAFEKAIEIVKEEGGTSD